MPLQQGPHFAGAAQDDRPQGWQVREIPFQRGGGNKKIEEIEVALTVFLRSDVYRCTRNFSSFVRWQYDTVPSCRCTVVPKTFPSCAIYDLVLLHNLDQLPMISTHQAIR